MEVSNLVDIAILGFSTMAPDDFPAGRTPSPFHIAEYQAVQSDIELNHRIGFNVVVYATIANGLIMAWVLQYIQTSPQAKLPSIIAIVIPFVLTFFAVLKFRHTLARMRFDFMYIHAMEEIYRECDLGYQHFYRSSEHSNYLRHSQIVYLALGVQLCLLIIFACLTLLGFL
jgi:hypothetical protein